MNSPISPHHYTPQTAEEILAQIRELDTEIAKCNIKLAQIAAAPSLAEQFMSGKTYPIPPFLSSCCESNKIPANGDTENTNYFVCGMCGEPCS